MSKRQRQFLKGHFVIFAGDDKIPFVQNYSSIAYRRIIRNKNTIERRLSIEKH